MHLSTRAPAKVNLSLLVGPRRADGYHELFSVFAPLDLHDRLSFTLSLGAAAQRPGVLTLDCPALDAGAAASDPERNLAVRALRALEGAAGRAISGSVRIEKDIPVGAGMGGGSSDAAAALLAGARLLAEEGGAAPAPEVLHSLAVSLGADVPFFLGQGAAVGRGIGDLLQPISLPPIPLVIVLPAEPLSTPVVYAAFDRLAASEDISGFAARTLTAEEAWREMARDWEGGDRDGAAAAEAVVRVVALLRNDLEAASFTLLPHLPEAKQAILDAGALGALMSGSGPTLFGVCRSAEEAEDACRLLVARGYAARPALAGSCA